MRLEINLEKIAKDGKDRYAENKAFKDYLDTQDNDAVDAIVKKLNEEVSPNISCVDCGKCCENLRPIATTSILKQFVAPENMEEFRYAESFTCMHLKDKKCTMYLERPDVCRDYPYMDRPNFISRTHSVLFNYEVCPIVYNIYEELKKELKWTYNA